MQTHDITFHTLLLFVVHCKLHSGSHPTFQQLVAKPGEEDRPLCYRNTDCSSHAFAELRVHYYKVSQYQPLAEKKRRRLFCVAAAATTASSSPRTAATTCSNQVCKVKEVQGGEYAARTACSSRLLTTTHHYLQHVHEVARLAAVLDHVAFLPLGGLLRFGPRERPSVAVAGVCALDGAPVG